MNMKACIRQKESELSILKGKTAVVTGSTSGIGLGCARAFAGAGANIVLNGIGAPAAGADAGFVPRRVSIGSRRRSARRANHFVRRATACPAPSEKIFWFSETANQFYISAIPPHTEGVAQRHERGAGCGGRGWCA